MVTVGRMRYVLATICGFDLFTDHNNLVLLFNPTAVFTGLSQTTMKKNSLLAVRLSAYNYVFVHILDSLIVWDDIISRWISPLGIRRLVTTLVLLSCSFDKFGWPYSPKLSAAQLTNLD